MHILMTTDTVGGVWTYCLELARALRPFGAHVFLAAKGRPTIDQVALAESLENVTLVIGDYKLEWMKDPWQDVQRAGEWLLDLADDLRPDLIHLNDYAHGALPWKAPVLMVGHSCIVSWLLAVRQEEPGREWDRYRREVREGLRGADLVVAPTRHMYESLNRHYGPLPRGRVIPNGCDVKRFSSLAKEPWIFSAGRLRNDAKNLTRLTEAAPHLDWPVRMAGLPQPDGSSESVDGVPGLTWLGRLSAPAMAAAYSNAAVYALPALYEPFGLTVLEAALSGCALVLGDIPTLRENWNGAALFVPPHDVQQLIRSINVVCREEPLRRALAERALRRGRELTSEHMARAYYRSYCRLAKRVRPAAVA